MDPTNSSVNNQVAKLEVGGAVAVNPCRGPNSLGQQLHGATTPVVEDRCRSTTTTLTLKGINCIVRERTLTSACWLVVLFGCLVSLAVTLVVCLFG